MKSPSFLRKVEIKMTTYYTSSLTAAARRLVKLCVRYGVTVGTAESCTGGLIAKAITDIPGSSAALCGGLVTYTNEVKIKLLGVDPAIIERDTEVSLTCAKAMAEGARECLGVTLAVSTTGFAGPGGGTETDPVGTVYLGLATPQGVISERFSAPPCATRAQVRNAAALRALTLLCDAIEAL